MGGWEVGEALHGGACGAGAGKGHTKKSPLLNMRALCMHPSQPAVLAQNLYLEDPAFLNYLKYLDYWRQPQYAKYLQ